MSFRGREGRTHHFVRQDQTVELLRNVANLPQLVLTEHLSNRIVRCLLNCVSQALPTEEEDPTHVDPNHLDLSRRESSSQLAHVDLPVGGFDVAFVCACGCVDGDEDGGSSAVN
jgi:hypothetical protein